MENRESYQQGSQNGRGRQLGGGEQRYGDSERYRGQQQSGPGYDEGYQQDFGGQYGGQQWHEDRGRQLGDRSHAGPHYGALEHERYTGQDHQARYREAYEGEGSRVGMGGKRVFDDFHEDNRRRMIDAGRVDYGDDRRNRFGYGGSQGYGPYTGGPGYRGEERGFRDQERTQGEYGTRDRSNQLGTQGFNQAIQGSRGRIQRGQFYGKGPRGFSYSDEDIRSEISRSLYEHGEIDASDVEVQVQNGEVTITGTVDSRSTKNRIEELIEEQIHGVRDINNQVRVKKGLLSSLFSSNGEREQGESDKQTQSPGITSTTSTERPGTRKESR